MRARTWWLVAAAALAVLACSSAMAADPQPAVSVETESVDACLDYTPVEGTELEPALLLGAPDAEAAAPKPCRGCARTYNGFPRVSCDPCCYANDIGVLICTS